MSTYRWKDNDNVVLDVGFVIGAFLALRGLLVFH